MKLREAILYVTDMNRAREFYEKLGIFCAMNQDNTYCNLKVVDEDINVSLALAPEKNPGHQTIVLSVPEIERFHKDIQALGIKIEVPLQDKGWGQTFYLRDPDGNRLEFVEEVTND
jgi:catechol 2,3-dioxygenase-like lactoylglutathione lyase family enzyme